MTGGVSHLRHIGEDKEDCTLLSEQLCENCAFVGDAADPPDVVHVHLNALKSDLILE